MKIENVKKFNSQLYLNQIKIETYATYNGDCSAATGYSCNTNKQGLTCSNPKIDCNCPTAVPLDFCKIMEFKKNSQ